MPVYEYQCGKCEVLFENEHPMVFSGKVRCPACGSRRTIKVFHAAGVHFKGSGFYVTDSSKSRAAANSDTKDITPAAKDDTDTKSTGDADAASTSEKKTETKPSKRTASTTSAKSKT